jgi:hypothetical protein
MNSFSLKPCFGAAGFAALAGAGAGFATAFVSIALFSAATGVAVVTGGSFLFANFLSSPAVEVEDVLPTAAEAAGAAAGAGEGGAALCAVFGAATVTTGADAGAGLETDVVATGFAVAATLAPSGAFLVSTGFAACGVLTLTAFAAIGAGAAFAVPATAVLPDTTGLFAGLTAALAAVFVEGDVCALAIVGLVTVFAAALEAAALDVVLPTGALPEVAPRAAEFFAAAARGDAEAGFAVFALVTLLALLVFAAVFADFAADRAGALALAAERSADLPVALAFVPALDLAEVAAADLSAAFLAATDLALVLLVEEAAVRDLTA